MDFKVSYLDAGLPNSYFSDSDQLLSSTNVAQHNLTVTPSRVNRRYKTQLRDFLSTCRTKRKLSHSSSSGQVTPPATATATTSVVSPMPATVDYIAPDAYNMYSSSYTAAPDHTLPYMSHGNFHQHGLYPDNRYFTTTENIFQYRPLGTYYPEYPAAASPYNGFPTYDPTPTTSHYPCQQDKYQAYVDSSRPYSGTWPYSVSPSSGIIQPVQVMELGKQCKVKTLETSPGLVKMEERDFPQEIPRQTVLMWGSNPPTTDGTELSNQELCKWNNGEEKTEQPQNDTNDSPHHHTAHHNHHNSRVVMVL